MVTLKLSLSFAVIVLFQHAHSFGGEDPAHVEYFKRMRTVLKAEDHAATLARTSPAVAVAHAKPIPTRYYKHQVTLDDDGAYWLYWESNATHVTFEVHVKTHGYVGFGLTTNGKMFPSDVVIGWVSNGTAYLKDYHTVAHAMPIEDESQDYHLISGAEYEFGTRLTFTRKHDTCDDKDFLITEDTTKAIFSYHPSDPTDATSLAWHGRVRRGTKSLYLLSGTDKPSMIPSDLQHIDFQKRNISVPARDTTYHCTTFRMPIFPNKHHIISYTPIIQKENVRHVHHFVLYVYAEAIDSQYDNLNYDCTYGKETPDALNHRQRSIYIAWAVGGGKYYLPENVGLPIGRGSDPAFFVLETHYDNPTLKQGIVDSSGIRFSYTSVLRQHDAGMIYTGMSVSPLHLIPPHEAAFVSKGFCHPECTKASSIPDDGINVFAVFQHAHLLGRAITTRHFRNGTELEPIAEDHYYDFDYQDVRSLKKEVVLKKGDSMVVECTLDSRHKNSPTYGGLSTHEEMCISTLMYYPLVDMNGCISSPNYEVIEAGNFTINPYERGQAVVDILAKWNWTEPSVRQKFKNILADTDYSHICTGIHSTDQNGHGVSYKFISDKELKATPYVHPTRDCPRT